MVPLANMPQPRGRVEAANQPVDQIPHARDKDLKPDSEGVGGHGALLVDADTLRRLSSSSPFAEFASPTPLRGPPSRVPSYGPPPTGAAKPRVPAPLARFWARHRGPLLVIAAQFFGVLMNLCVRILEHSADAVMHPFQLLFARQVVTLAVGNAYMWRHGTPGFPIGAREVRPLLVLRGITGFFGIWGMWQSITYLPLAEATVITFLVPCVVGYMCHLAMKDPFTRREQIACFVALGGVVLIARPASLFSWAGGSPGAGQTSPVLGGENATAIAIQGAAQTAPSSAATEAEPTPLQRLGAIAAGLIGVLGTSAAFMSIRWIGTRAHPLVSINYFGAACAIISAAALVLAPLLDIGQPLLRFALPHGLWQWFLLLMVCVCGFMTQFCITSGLSAERSNRATMMVYTGMLFAAGFDKLVWGAEMGLMSVVGCGLIIGGAVWAGLSKKDVPKRPGEQDIEADPGAAGGEAEIEGIPMLAEGDESDDWEGESDSSWSGAGSMGRQDK